MFQLRSPYSKLSSLDIVDAARLSSFKDNLSCSRASTLFSKIAFRTAAYKSLLEYANLRIREYKIVAWKAANKSESVQKSQPIEIVNIFKLTNHNKIYGLI